MWRGHSPETGKQEISYVIMSCDKSCEVDQDWKKMAGWQCARLGVGERDVPFECVLTEGLLAQVNSHVNFGKGK